MGLKPVGPPKVAQKPTSDDFAEWAERIQAGDREAETKLFERCYPATVLILRRRGAHEYAEDIAVEALWVVITKLRAGEVRNTRSLAAMIRSTAVNKLNNHFRSERTRQTKSIAFTASLYRRRENTWTPIQSLWHTDDSEGYRGMTEEELVEATRNAIKKIEKRLHRDVAWRLYIEQEDRDVICRHFGVTRVELSRIAYEARQYIRQILDF